MPLSLGAFLWLEEGMQWIDCEKNEPPKFRLLLLFVDGDYEFGQLRDDDYYIFTAGQFKKRYAPQEVTHYQVLAHP